MGRKVNRSQIPERESDILYILWKAGRPLMASEIADEGVKLTTVHTTLKRMLKKDMVEVVDFMKSGNVYGRCYQPKISMMEYELSKIAGDFKNKQCPDVTLTDIVGELLDDLEQEERNRELDRLEEVIKEIREGMEEDEKRKGAGDK